MSIALEEVRRCEEDLPRVVCSDSRTALATLASNAGAQTTTFGAALWGFLLELSAGGRQVHLQWASAHFGLPGNETADRLAKEASSLPQDDVSVDVRTFTYAVGRSASRTWYRSWNGSLFRRIIGVRMRNQSKNPETTQSTSVRKVVSHLNSQNKCSRHRQNKISKMCA